MALQIYDTTVIGSGIQADLGTTDDVYVAAGGFLGSSNFIAVDGTGSNHSVTVEGSVVAADFAISVGDDSALDSGEQVTIGVDAAIVSQNAYAIDVEGHGSSVENNGTITGFSGVSIDGDAASGASELVNNGEIHATLAAVFRLGSEDFQFTNNGLASGDADGAVYYAADSTGDQTVLNNGSLIGGVMFGSGNDTYDGSKGRITDGSVFAFDGNDTLTGGKYAETLGGGHGRDILKGGGGADHFKFTETADSTVAKTGRDLVLDFHHNQHDRLDLSIIDATASNGTNDPFSFIETKAFSGAEGELRCKFTGASTFVQGDADGDKHADFSIELKGHIALHAGDFIL